MIQQQYRPTKGEAPFEVGELFFSRTDERGVIKAGNSVFQRVAHFEWDKLLGAPHRVIRHEDMPRGVFHLLWTTIKSGEPIGAFVKNKSEDGLYYWVYAMITPIEGGFLSVRMKPTSPILKTVEAEYKALLKAEKEQNLSPEASMNALLARLAELGYPNYPAFMADALATEYESHCRRLETAPEPWLDAFRIIHKNVIGVSDRSHDLSRVFESIRGIPYNMRILASRLESAGGPISVISANYGILSDEIAGWMRSFSDESQGSFGAMAKAIDHGLFLQCVAHIQQEMVKQFKGEPDLVGHIDAAAESRQLEAQAEVYDQHAQEAVVRVVRQVEKFSASVRDMKRLITGLGATRMMCKIEGARLKNQGDNLTSVIAQLDQFQDNIEERLREIDDMNRLIQRTACSLIPCDEERSRASNTFGTAAE